MTNYEGSPYLAMKEAYPWIKPSDMKNPPCSFAFSQKDKPMDK